MIEVPALPGATKRDHLLPPGRICCGHRK